MVTFLENGVEIRGNFTKMQGFTIVSDYFNEQNTFLVQLTFLAMVI